MSVRLAKKEDKRSIYSILSYSFNGGNQQIENNMKDENLSIDGWLVNEENNVVTSAVKIRDFSMMFDGEFVKMGGVAGVCSAPEHRSGGAVKNILTYSLEYMKERGQIFSALGPFSFAFYRKYGWEWGFTFQLVNIPVLDLKNFPAANKYVMLTKEDKDMIQDYRLQYISHINGPLFHDESMSEEKWNSYYHNFTHIYASYDEKGNITAIAFFRIDGRVLRCDEMYFLNEIGRQHMLHLFYRHRSQIDEVELQLLRDDDIRLILPNQRIRFWEWANMMIRVVDVLAAFKKMKRFLNMKESICLKVHDAQAPWNNQTFEIFNQNIEIVEKECDFEIDIQRLSQLMLGFISGKEALQYNFVKVNNANKKEDFMSLFQKCPTMLWQMF